MTDPESLATSDRIISIRGPGGLEVVFGLIAVAGAVLLSSSNQWSLAVTAVVTATFEVAAFALAIAVERRWRRRAT